MSKICRTTHKVCAKCAGEHDTSECTTRAEDMKCANCLGPHPTYSKDCPYYKIAKQVDVLARTEKLSYAAATRRIKAASSAPATAPTGAPVAPNVNASPLAQQQKTSYPATTIHVPQASPETPAETGLAMGTHPVMVSTETQTPLVLCNEKFGTIGEFLSSNDFATFVEDIVTLAQTKPSVNTKGKVKQLISKLKTKVAKPKEVTDTGRTSPATPAGRSLEKRTTTISSTTRTSRPAETKATNIHPAATDPTESIYSKRGRTNSQSSIASTASGNDHPPSDRSGKKTKTHP